MKNLIVDIGNTRIKTGLFVEYELVEERVMNALEVVNAYASTVKADQVIISSVRESEPELKNKLSFPFHFFSHTTPVPVENRYGTPATLGLDRLAAVVGALSLAAAPLLAIDVGTCITYDLVDAGGAYRGGAISPGLRMRAKAMHAQTANLPLVEIDPEVEKVGDATVACLQSGIYHGVTGEIHGFIQSYSQKHGDLKVFICGGDAIYFERLTKDHIFVIPNLVLHGLNRILTYNVDTK